MSRTGADQSAPAFVVLKRISDGHWQILGEIDRKRGLPAKAARIQAIIEMTDGKAKLDEVYAAVLRSEWRVAMDCAR